MGRSKAVLPVIAAVTFLLIQVNSTLADGTTSAALASDDGAPLFQLSPHGPPVWLDAAPQIDKKAATAASQTTAFFQRGTWDFEVSGAHMSPVRSTRDYFDSGSTTLGYFIADNFSVNAALVGYSVDQPDHGAFAGGFDLYARYYFLTLDRFTFYIDAGAGAFLADKEVPERGTNFDFTPRRPRRWLPFGRQPLFTGWPALLAPVQRRDRRRKPQPEFRWPAILRIDHVYVLIKPRLPSRLAVALIPPPWLQIDLPQARCGAGQ